VAFRELAQWLAGHDAPAELVDRCLAAADDEVEHADALTALAAREGAEVPACATDPASDDLFSVALHNAVEGCVSEAFGALIAAHQAEQADDPRLRELLRTIADDELRHAQLAWDLHAWLWPRLTAPAATSARRGAGAGARGAAGARPRGRPRGAGGPRMADARAVGDARRTIRAPHHRRRGAARGRVRSTALAERLAPHITGRGIAAA